MMLKPMVHLIPVFVEMKRRGTVVTSKGLEQAVGPVRLFDFDDKVGDGAQEKECDEGFGGEGGLQDGDLGLGR